MKTERYLKKNGFTLTATLLVVVLIIIALFPLLRALSASLFVSADTEANIVALNLAMGKMEEIRNAPFASVSSEAKAQLDKFPRFSREVIVSSPHANLKNVTIFVYWTVSGGIEKMVSMETYAADF